MSALPHRQPWSEIALRDLPDALKTMPMVIVEFWAQDCLFGRLLAPTRRKLEADYAGVLTLLRCVVNGAEQECAELGVNALPALFLYENGKRTRRWIGEMHSSLVTMVLDKKLQEMKQS